MKIVSRRWGIWIAIALGIIFILTLWQAPQKSDVQGSTYSRSPQGYSAWYSYAQTQGIAIERWQKPLSDWTAANPQTLIRVYPQLERLPLDTATQNWISQGNTLIALGRYQPTTDAPFTDYLASAVGKVKIQTTRRATGVKMPLLGDRAEAVVWLEPLGEGRIIYATTPDLAANAYQDSPGNFDYLIQLATQLPTEDTQLVQNASRQIWFDEYIHQPQTVQEEENQTSEDNFWQYWLTTPILPLFIQGTVIFLLFLIASNRRFGPLQTLTNPEVNNSQAYIEALAGVLHKADCSEFALENLGKEEQRQLQKALGLGTTLLEPEELMRVWTEQTQESPATLQNLLQTQKRQRHLKDATLGQWYLTWQKLLNKSFETLTRSPRKIKDSNPKTRSN
ncbi:MAG: DUF4350 domain-containing protein [Jaaginema sp. PMC 1079.18]|nr:DUF4350 domain-containing protein [Jaaginema sp. PMC 1080.18]MEC4852280.1 DUF4350 domain-containing protein [Jaaginema sp. PMC 1079.18]MEC4867208.1 DUF4350 domain-containing protein [Jaaginema sp. PMC 1078.18]